MSEPQDGETEPIDADGPDPLLAAAVVFLHREIVSHGEVRLTPEDFMAIQRSEDTGQFIQLRLDGRDIVLYHGRPDAGVPVN